MHLSCYFTISGLNQIHDFPYLSQNSTKVAISPQGIHCLCGTDGLSALDLLSMGSLQSIANPCEFRLDLLNFCTTLLS